MKKTATITITIETLDNDEAVALGWRTAAARMLRDAARAIERGDTRRTRLLDTNGNAVARITYTEEPRT